VRVLILGGTAQARALADALHDQGCHQVVSSLGGRTSRPVLPGGDVRIGGFGGVDGLVGYLRAESVDVLVDATHPFAERISANAVQAAAGAGVRLLALRRRAWAAEAGDRWVVVPSVAAAAREAAGLAAGAVVFLALGRQELAAFAGDSRHFYVIRSVETPGGVLPPRHRVVLERGPFTVDGERALLRDFGVAAVVCRNSGGSEGRAKLVAAREAGVPVIMVAAPVPMAGVTSVETVAEIVDLLGRGA
jgi:precorrin-6A/cobalt-precorrin-6A reductase